MTVSLKDARYLTQNAERLRQAILSRITSGGHPKAGDIVSAMKEVLNRKK